MGLIYGCCLTLLHTVSGVLLLYVNLPQMRKYAFLLVLFTGLLAACSSKKKLARHHNDLLDTYHTLKEDLPDAGVTMTGEKVEVVFPEAILFSFDSATIHREYYPAFEKMAEVFNKYPRTSILITGYTDTIGTEQYNNALGKRRADAAKELLIQKGVRPRRIYSWGLGTKDPVADNNTIEGRQQNRRVEFVILYDYNAKVKVN